MAEAASARGPGLSGIAWGELRRRTVFRVALLALLALCTLAVHAPLLANDRPLVLIAVHRGEFDRARRSLVGPTQALAGLVTEGADAYARRRGPDSNGEDWEAALAG